MPLLPEPLSPSADEDLLDPAAVAEWTKVPERTLAQWRYLGKPPIYLKLGAHVRYRRGDVARWLAECEQMPDAS